LIDSTIAPKLKVRTRHHVRGSGKINIRDIDDMIVRMNISYLEGQELSSFKAQMYASFLMQITKCKKHHAQNEFKPNFTPKCPLLY
jgi:hypothetical protein